MNERTVRNPPPVFFVINERTLQITRYSGRSLISELLCERVSNLFIFKVFVQTVETVVIFPQNSFASGLGN